MAKALVAAESQRRLGTALAGWAALALESLRPSRTRHRARDWVAGTLNTRERWGHCRMRFRVSKIGGVEV